MNGDETRRLTAYHEAGHAVAAVISPGGRVDEIDISFNEEFDERGHTLHHHEPADQAFIIYAGPWAHALAWTIDETYQRPANGLIPSPDKVAEAFRCNHDDWYAYERQMRGDVDVIKAFIDEEVGAFAEERKCRLKPPPLTEPDPKWDGKLGKAWPEIEELARAMLAGTEVIELSNGDRLDWQGRELPNRWRNPDAPREVEYKSPG